MSWLSDLFGGDESRTEGVKYPDWYTDPKFSGSQDFLDQYSRDLLTKGPNDYYAPIGEYGTPEFMSFLNSSNHETLAGIEEATARTGRARGGRVGEIAAQELGDTNAKLLYADYMRAMKGRGDFLNTGLNVQANVRDAGFANQGARNAFNVGGANFDYNKAVYGDAYDRQSSQDQGAMIGKILNGVAGAGVGFMTGGTVGAVAGGLGGLSGGGAQWLDILNQSKGKASGTTSSTETATPGVSTIGSIRNGAIDPDTLMKMFANLN